MAPSVQDARVLLFIVGKVIPELISIPFAEPLEKILYKYPEKR